MVKCFGEIENVLVDMAVKWLVVFGFEDVNQQNTQMMSNWSISVYACVNLRTK